MAVMTTRKADILAEYHYNRALWCLATRQTPDVYDALTDIEAEAWNAALTDITKRR